MKKNYLYEMMSGIDEKYIEEAMDLGHFRKNKSFNARRIVLVAACVAIMAAACIAVPLMMRNNVDVPDIPPYDFTSPEFKDFEIEGTTLVSYKGEIVDELVIPEGIEAIADYAFLDNTNSSKIKTISLSSTVKSLGANALAGCNELKELKVGDNSEFVERGDLLMTANGETIIQYIGDTEITSYSIPEGVKYIAAHAFQMTEIEHCTFPEGLLYIGYNAFAGLPLSEIHLPSSMIELANGAFGSCCWAFEGSYPEDMVFTESSFDMVPFYLTKLAGKPCPSEDIGKGNVTISEAFKMSNAENITEQFADVLEYYATGIVPADTFCYGGIHEGQALPEGAILPDIDSLDFASLQLIERDWNSKTNVDVVIPCEGGYDMLIGYRLYDRWDRLYWKDVRWRVEAISFIPNDAAGSADLAIGDWFIEYEMNGEQYSAITFTNSSGVSVYEHRFPSEAEYRYQISPDGQSFIVEYLSMGVWSFFIEDLTGELYHTWWSYEAPCVPYYIKADGKYLAHTAEWNTDPETMEEFPIRAQNEHGEFLMNYHTGEILRDDMYIYYDLVYTSKGIKWNEEQTVYDGSDKYDIFAGFIGYICEGDINGELLAEEYSYKTQGLLYKAPHTWDMGAFDTERGENNWRAEFIGRLIKVPEDFEMTLANHFTAVPDAVDATTFKLYKGDGVYIKEWTVAEAVDIVVSEARRSIFVEIRTMDDYIIPIIFYSYSDGDSADYFDRVIVPIVESVRLCEGVKITELKAEKKNDGQFMTVAFEDGEQTLSGVLSLDGIVDMNSYTDEDIAVYDPSAEPYPQFMGLYNYMIMRFEGDYYFTFEGVFVNKYTFIFENGIFKPLNSDS
ncbi:MAG: leucine-rich repeat domain-containing protein [Clostridia bacterium]|nr:leucine-rich repeat domain-containing protein [Clostridia bacterium]